MRTWLGLGLGLGLGFRLGLGLGLGLGLLACAAIIEAQSRASCGEADLSTSLPLAWAEMPWNGLARQKAMRISTSTNS